MGKYQYLLDVLGVDDELVRRVWNSSYFESSSMDFYFLSVDLYLTLSKFYLDKACSDLPSCDPSILRDIVKSETSRITGFINGLALVRLAIEKSDPLEKLLVRLNKLRNEAVAFSRGFSGVTEIIDHRLSSCTMEMYDVVMEKVLGRKLRRGEEHEVVFVKDKLAQAVIRRVVEWCTEGIRFLDYHTRKRA